MTRPFVSRAGLKLEHALAHFQIDVANKTCADLGCNAGGFVDCLLRRGASKVYAIDTGYGALDWNLRKDPRVVAMERTNAMHVSLTERVEIVTIDVAWTRQRHILPNARKLLVNDGICISLIKPHYEAQAPQLRGGVLPREAIAAVIDRVKLDAQNAGFTWVDLVESPIRGAKGNSEFLAMLRPASSE